MQNAEANLETSLELSNENRVLCLGMFHVACAFLPLLGERFEGGGLRDILAKAHRVWPQYS